MSMTFRAAHLAEVDLTPRVETRHADDLVPAGAGRYSTVVRYLSQPEVMQRLLSRWLRDRPHAIPGAIAVSDREGWADLIFDAFFLDPARAAPIRARLLRETAERMRGARHAEIDDTKRYVQGRSGRIYDPDNAEQAEARRQADAEVNQWLAAALVKAPAWEFDEAAWRDRSTQRKPPWIDPEFGVRVPGERDLIHVFLSPDGALSMGDPSGVFVVTEGDLPQQDADELRARGVVWLRLGAEYWRFSEIPKARAQEEL